MENIKVIGFDADDTLWVHEPFYNDTTEKFCQLLAPYINPSSIEQRLYETELKNLRIFGYGIKGFMLSMVETAIELTDGKVTGKEIHQIIDFGKTMLQHPVKVLEGVPDVLSKLGEHYQLMMVTKGDLFDQEGKIARSGLADHFKYFEIVSEKDASSYRRVLRRHGIVAEEFLMIGNSVKSDVLPVLDIGGHAIHVPFHITWGHEKVSAQALSGRAYKEVANIRQVLSYLLSA